MVLVQEATNSTKTEITQLMLNAFKTVWLPELEKQKDINNLINYTESNAVNWSLFKQL